VEGEGTRGEGRVHALSVARRPEPAPPLFPRVTFRSPSQPSERIP
jgi:hypothetical protein